MSQSSLLSGGGTVRLDYSRRCAVQSCTWHPLLGSQHCLDHQGYGAAPSSLPRGGPPVSAMQDFMGSVTEIHYGIRPVSFSIYSPSFHSLVGSQAATFVQGSAEAIKAAIPLVQWHFGGGLGTPPFQRDFNPMISDIHALFIDAPNIEPNHAVGSVGLAVSTRRAAGGANPACDCGSEK